MNNPHVLRRRAAGAAAAACAVLVLSPRLDKIADRSFAWHMAQHLALMFALAPLLLLARPFDDLRPLLSKRATARLVTAGRVCECFADPRFGLPFFVAVLWVSHFSGLYELALECPAAHFAEHALYLTAGVCFWLPVIAPPPIRPIAFPLRLLYLFVALPQGALLALALGAANRPLYAHYRITEGIGALVDQQDAAALMWIAGGIAFFSAILITLGVWAARESRAQRSAAEG